jgi:homoserine kinase
LQLYLSVKIEQSSSAATEFEIIASGEGSAGAEALPCNEENLIVRVARFVSRQRGRTLVGGRLRVDNQIPLKRGLGSSSAAIIAGISLYEALAEESLHDEEFFEYALKFEAHGDNLAPSKLGGLVVACVTTGRKTGKETLTTVRRNWPDEVRIVVVIPELALETERMRAALPSAVPLEAAVFNLQRAALFQALISERRFDLLHEALKDKLHQPFRAPLAPPLGEVLELNSQVGKIDGLLGVAISGAGSTMIAFVAGNSKEIGMRMQAPFEARRIKSRIVEIKVDNDGRRFV